MNKRRGHSQSEERWITLGRCVESGILLVVHTFVEYNENLAEIRIISARKASKNEKRTYQGEDMKDEYDFSKATKGKFFKKDSEIHIPIYLTPDLERYFIKLAKQKKANVK